MNFYKVIPYKIKRLVPMAMIAGMPFVPISCCKEDPHHNTTYVWGYDYWTEIWPADKVKASADSTQVDFVILKNDGEPFQGRTTSTIMKQLNTVLADISDNNRRKIRGEGILNDTGMLTLEDKRDSILLSNMGFKVGKVHSGK